MLLRSKQKKLNKHGFFLLILLLGFFFFLLYSLSFTPVLLWDETAYLANARSHIAESNYREEFRGPMLEYIIAFSWFFIGESIFVARLIIILMATATVFFVYLICREIFENKYDSLFFVLLLALCPLFLFWSNKAYPNVAALFFVTGSFYFLLKNEKSANINLTILAAVFASLAFLVRYTTGSFVFSIFAYFLISRRYREMIYFAITSFLVLLPWLTGNFLAHHNPLFHFIYSYTEIAKYTVGIHVPWTVQIMNILGFMGILILFIPFGVYYFIKNLKKRGILSIILLYPVLFYIFHLFIAKFKLARYNIEILSFLYLFSFGGIFFFLVKIRKKSWKKVLCAVIALLVVFSSVAYLAVKYSTDAYKKECSIYQSTEYAKNLPKDVVYASNFWPYFGYYNNFRVYSLWTEDIERLMEIYPLKRIIYSESFGIIYNMSIFEKDYLRLNNTVSACGDNVYFYDVII